MNNIFDESEHDMKQRSSGSTAIRRQAIIGLRNAFQQHRPDIAVNENGYVDSYTDNLPPHVEVSDFEADLTAGDGNELATKFRAVHSSSALAVNCFAPFRRRIEELVMPFGGPFHELQFERKCPTGLRGGKSPNLDVLLSGPNGVIGIESKLTEYLGKHRANFSPAYAAQIRDERREQGYFLEMLRLVEEPDSYVWLDAAQLIKHAFGLAHTFRDRKVTLLYLFWEPTDPTCHRAFGEHRDEIARFAQRVAGSTPAFLAMSYAQLWSGWRPNQTAWLTDHLSELSNRYSIHL
ncbi:MAG: hypothetical protein WAT77_13030 [Paracoccaceae bacterium]